MSKKRPSVQEFINGLFKEIEQQAARIKELTTENTRLQAENSQLKAIKTAAELEKDSFDTFKEAVRELVEAIESNTLGVKGKYRWIGFTDIEDQLTAVRERLKNEG